jgi:hypothetical protein
VSKFLTDSDYGGVATAKGLRAPIAAGEAAKVDITVEDVTTTTYTLVAADIGKTKRFTNAAGCAVTCPNNFAINWNTQLVQWGAGQVVVSTTGGAIRNRQGFSKTAGLYASMALAVMANSGGSAAEYWAQGDMSA